MKPETLVTTLGREPEAHEGVVNAPVYRTSTILFKTLAEFETCERGDGVRPLVYGRTGTPSTRALEESLAALDGSDHAMLTCSGQSAIVVLLHAMLSSGGHLLLPDSLYATMRKYCIEELPRFGIEVEFYNSCIGKGIAEHIRPNTQLIYCESPGSHTFEMQDIPAIVEVARAHKIPVAADNTWATPLYQNTTKLGVDIAINACTKYIGGHADIVMGLITCSKQYYPTIRRTFRNMGICPGSEEVFLCARGLRSLPVRLKQHQQNALSIAHWLREQPEVERIFYPALPDDPGHALWKRDCTGASGLFSFELKPVSKKQLAAMLDHMQLFGMGVSWGGYESLILPFRAQRKATPQWQPKGPTLRISTGLEHSDDLITDLAEGLKRMKAAA